MGPLKFFVREFITVFIFSSAPFGRRTSICPSSSKPGASQAESSSLHLFVVDPFSVPCGSRKCGGADGYDQLDQCSPGIDGVRGFRCSSRREHVVGPSSILFWYGHRGARLVVLRVGVTDGNQDPGNCTSVEHKLCRRVRRRHAGNRCEWRKGLCNSLVAAGGVRDKWKHTLRSRAEGAARLSTSDYALYATWLANLFKSLKSEYGISLYAISVCRMSRINASHTTVPFGQRGTSILS